MTTKAVLDKSLLKERWGEFFDQFTNGNHGRLISIKIINSELFSKELIAESPLMAIVYDRPGKGDNLVIEVGQTQVTYAHTIDSPTEVFTNQNPDDGEIIAIWISDASGAKTVISLQPSSDIA